MTSSYITGVDFVTIPTDDFDAAVHFYGTVLGLPAGKRWGDMPAAEFQAGNLTLAVPVALQVDDVAQAREHLESQGVKFTTDIIDSGVCHQAIFSDPSGNALDLHHRYAPPA
jgi:predicted enzyme related to lactoylglutathione lyase